MTDEITQASTENITEAAIQEVVEAEIEKYSHRMGRCKDENYCQKGKMVKKPYSRRLPSEQYPTGYKVTSHEKHIFLLNEQTS